MVVLGIIVLLAAAALVLLLVTAGTSQDVVLDLMGGQQLTTSPIWVFLAGAVTVLLAVIGFWLISRGTRRAVARRREIRNLRQAAAVTSGQPDEHGGAPRGVDDEPAADRVLVRDVDELRAREGVRPAGGSSRSPEATVDPEGGRHELRLDDLGTPEHRH